LVFEFVHESLGVLVDGNPGTFVWFSAGHASRAAVYVIWKVFHGFLCGFPASHVSLGLYLLDGIPRTFIWLSASHVSSTAVYVILRVFREFLLGFPAGHVFWVCLSVIWMVFRWMFYFVYLFIVIWISSHGFPYSTGIWYLFHIHVILL
jgi:hypothetical protein